MRSPPGAGSADARHRPRASSADAPGAAASGAPAVTAAEQTSLRDESLSWAAQHGLLVATEGAPGGATMPAVFTHAPVSLLPTPFPRGAFELAKEVSPFFAELSDLVSRDHAFLETTLSGVLETDAFTKRLWDVYIACGAQAGRHRCEVGVLRADYMLDAPSGAPLQVEVNTVSTSFMALSTRVAQMHRHNVSYFANLQEKYIDDASILSSVNDTKSGETKNDDDFGEVVLERVLPRNDALASAAATLAAGHAAAGDANAHLLMVVQPGETNVFDQRLLAETLWNEHGVSVTRATLAEIADEASVDDSTSDAFVSFRGVTHSLVYFRAGYAPSDYPSEKEWHARLLLEQSGAVKSPSAAMQLAGTKKIQQALAAPGALERFAPRFAGPLTEQSIAERCAKMRLVFAGLYALDDKDASHAVSLALADPGGFVLKPQREGGGNNLYGEEMVAVLRTHDPSAPRGAFGDLSAYILMQRIFPPTNQTLCLRKGEMVALETLSELGIYGGYVRVGEAVTRNAHGGHLLRTKAATSDEGGVAAGFAVLDSVVLEG
jgi:glutathione synthase